MSNIENDIDVKQIAKTLGVTQRWVRTFIKRSDFPRPVKRGRWNLEDVRRWNELYATRRTESFPSIEKAWLEKHLSKIGIPIVAEFKNYPAFSAAQVFVAADDIRAAWEKYLTRKNEMDAERARQKVEADEERARKICEAKSLLEAKNIDCSDTIIWPAGNAAITRRIKKAAGCLAKNVTAWDGKYSSVCGVQAPVGCVKVAFGISTDFDLLLELLRAVFNTNAACAKGYGRLSRLRNGTRYWRKDEGIEAACKLAMNIANLRWGWGIDHKACAYSDVVYFDLPGGQLSFHCCQRYDGPDYAGQWNGKQNQVFPGDPEPIEGEAPVVPHHMNTAEQNARTQSTRMKRQQG